MIINSILDTDLYKLSMQNFVLRQYSEAEAEYVFVDRDNRIKFTPEAFEILQDEVNKMQMLRLTDYEYDWIKTNIRFFDVLYRQYLSSYRFNPNQVKLSLTKDGFLKINIKGKWRETILWEVPLMALISELYFKEIDKDWFFDYNIEVEKAKFKAQKLTTAGCLFGDFGSRRRRSFEIQDIVVKTMKEFKNFTGTSNVFLAMKHNVKALGTIAHECYQAVSVLESLAHANRFTNQKWQEVYKADLGTCLPDTFGSDAFLVDFDLKSAKVWDGPRQDSGDPLKWTDKFENHYKKFNIDYRTKTFLYSDNLNCDKAIAIHKYCNGRMKDVYGIGTFFTNDFMKKSDPTIKSKALNMVIKLWSMNGKYVVKLGDGEGKEIGEKDALRVAKWTFKNKSLDEK